MFLLLNFQVLLGVLTLPLLSAKENSQMLSVVNPNGGAESHLNPYHGRSFFFDKFGGLYGHLVFEFHGGFYGGLFGGYHGGNNYGGYYRPYHGGHHGYGLFHK